MREAPGRTAGRQGPARHERPAIDEAAMIAARHADRIPAATGDEGLVRWEAFCSPTPDRLRDAELRELYPIALRARDAYGAKASNRDAVPPELTAPFLDSIDPLVRELNRLDAGPSN